VSPVKFYTKFVLILNDVVLWLIYGTILLLLLLLLLFIIWCFSMSSNSHTSAWNEVLDCNVLSSGGFSWRRTCEQLCHFIEIRSSDAGLK